MKSRLIILGIDDITRILKDYVGLVGFPADAQPIKFMLNPQERKLAIVVESEEFKGPQEPEEIRFDLRRVFGVGSPAPDYSVRLN